MSDILVVFASHYGRTRAIVERMAQRLRDRGNRVVLCDSAAERPPHPAGFDCVILGSRIELGRWSSEVVAYARAHRNELAAVTSAAFDVCMAAEGKPQGDGTDANGYVAKFCDDVGLRPRATASFAGGLPYRRYNWITRQIMKLISKSAGHTTDTSRDHVFTDDAAVIAFADKVATLVAAQAIEQRVVPN